MTFEVLFTLFNNFLTKYYAEQLRSQQSQFFKRINSPNVDINHKSHQCMNKNSFSFDIALIMNFLRNGPRVGWASVLGLLTGPVTVNGQSGLKKYLPAPFLTATLQVPVLRQIITPFRKDI